VSPSDVKFGQYLGPADWPVSEHQPRGWVSGFSLNIEQKTMSNTASGVVETLKQGGGFLRDPARSFQSDRSDVFVPQKVIQRFGLVTGALVNGSAESGKKGMRVSDVESICGMKPEDFRRRTPFSKLLPINPDKRFRLDHDGNPSMRIVELFAPIGRGTRGLIVSPPKAGKTTLLEELTKAICADAPEARVVVLLIDERPEEVTHFRRQVPAEVLASSNDQSLAEHVRLAHMCMAQVRCELECGHDVVVLVDSITRMGRAFNSHGTDSGRTMSGGLDARALEIPRKFFGMARNIEDGGSVTVLATALVDTGSRMDGLIFEEFKGTGNSEIVLDRSLAESRIFPALRLRDTGTRRDEELYSAAEMEAINKLRRQALAVPPQQAIEGMLKLLKQYPTNEDLLAKLD
jgi:transcription termination factor Rho